jgi:Phospholipase_D-nuclease N-terminal/Short C-terminal domain
LKFKSARGGRWAAAGRPLQLGNTTTGGQRMQLVATEFTFGDVVVTILEFALLFFWIWIGISVVVDIFRSHDLSGWAKAAWILAIVVLPLLGVLMYLIIRGDRLKEHAIGHAHQEDAAFRAYVRRAAPSPADDIAKLDDLRNRGILTDDEFKRAKEQALAA